MSGRERVLKGYAVKLVSGEDAVWTMDGESGITARSPHSRCAFATYGAALETSLKSYNRLLGSGRAWRIRIVAIYTRPRRTAEQERADVVAWLRHRSTDDARILAARIEHGQHIGAAK